MCIRMQVWRWQRLLRLRLVLWVLRILRLRRVLRRLLLLVRAVVRGMIRVVLLVVQQVLRLDIGKPVAPVERLAPCLE